MKAISIRQPWAWLIVNGHKDVENRVRRSHYIGPLLIHAALGMTHEEYEAALAVAAVAKPGLKVPAFEDLSRGGFVGKVVMVACMRQSMSPWFFGPFGYIFRDARTVPFEPAKGQLGIWETGVSL